jgi:hypothetical protein
MSNVYREPSKDASYQVSIEAWTYTSIATISVFWSSYSWGLSGVVCIVLIGYIVNFNIIKLFIFNMILPWIRNIYIY